MKSLTWRLCLMATFAWLTLFGKTTMAVAAEQDGGGPGPRLERLEQRINELAQRQEQLLRRLGAQPERQEQLLRQPGAQPVGPGPITQPGPENPRRPMPAVGPAGEPTAPAAAKALQDIGGLLRLCVLVGIVFNILLAVWIFTDIRKRGEGSGIFIVLALLAGIPAAIIYTLTRIGDRKA